MTGEFGQEGDPGDPGLQGDEGFAVRQNKEKPVENKTNSTCTDKKNPKHFLIPLHFVLLCYRDFLGSMVCQAQKVVRGTQLSPKRKVPLILFLSYFRSTVELQVSKKRNTMFICVCDCLHAWQCLCIPNRTSR